MFIDIKGKFHYCFGVVHSNGAISLRIVKYLLVIILSFSGCTNTVHKDAILASETVFSHTIKYPGETLEIISLWYTGTYANLKKIREYNGHIKFDVLPIGQNIRIPESIMTTQKPLEEAFVTSNVAQNKKRRKKPLEKPTSDSSLVDESISNNKDEINNTSEQLDPQDELIDKLIDPSHEEPSTLDLHAAE